MEFRDRLVLVTGGAGSIGSNLVKELLKRGGRVILLDDLSSGFIGNLPKSQSLEFVKGSVLDDEILGNIFARDIEFVFHLAANFANQNSVDHPFRDLTINAGGTVKILEHSRSLRSRQRVVIISSSCVYGHCDGIIAEEAKTKPQTPYAISKLMSEDYSHFYFRFYGLPIVVLRYFNSYGPGERPGEYRNVIPNFLKLAMEGKSLPITGTGEESRSFTFVDDIVEGTVRAAIVDESIGETFNLGSHFEIKVSDLARKINRLTGNESGFHLVGRRKWDNINRRPMSFEKAKRILGYQPTIGLDEGLRRSYAWMKELQERGKL